MEEVQEVLILSLIQQLEDLEEAVKVIHPLILLQVEIVEQQETLLLNPVI